MSETKTISATLRDRVGKGANKALRREGKVPCVMYSAGREPVALAIGNLDAKDVVDHPAILPLEVDGATHNCLVKEVQRHFLTHNIQHIDLQAVQEDRKITTIVPIVPRGDAAGLHHGGILEQLGHTCRVECLPKDLPEKVVCDVSALDVGQRILTRDLVLPEGVKALSEPTTVLFAIHLPRAAVAAKAAEGE